MFHSYDVINKLHKKITYDAGVFTPVSNGTKIIKFNQEMQEI